MHVRQVLGVSEREACRALSQSRGGFRRPVKRAADEEQLTKDITRLALKYGRYGYKRITALLRTEGWRVNHKRVERIWRQEALKVPQKHKKKGRLYLNDGSCIRLRPCWPKHVWSYDFVAERLKDGTKIRTLTVIDEYTRECLALRTDYKLGADDVMATLTDLFVTRGVPDHMVDLFDGTEIVSKVPKTKIYSVSSVTINVTLPLARVADLNQRQLWLLGRLQQGLISKADDIEAAWGVTLRTAKRDIAGLINLDLIYFHGARKNGRYQLWNNPKY